MNIKPTEAYEAPMDEGANRDLQVFHFIDFSNNFSYPNWDLEEKIIQELLDTIRSRLDQNGLDAQARASVISSLFQRLSTPVLPLPTKAPELYKERANRAEKPDQFIRRVYSNWLSQPGGLPRPVLREIDSAAYRALYKHGIPDDFEDLLPTAQGRSASDLSRPDSEILAGYRQRNAAMQRAHSRKHLTT